MKELHTCPESLFWYYIQERHAIYERRKSSQAKPWTDDPILQKYKFCNVFRRLDRGTVWLIDHFLVPHKNDNLALLAFNICWYRCFNWEETGTVLGWQVDWDRAFIWEKLRKRTKVFTGAYIIHSEPGESKLDSIINVVGDLYLMRRELAHLALESQSMEAISDKLQNVRHIGPFMAYQMVLDMMYTPLLSGASDRETWACVGPGALRGLRRLFPDIKPKDALEEMRNLQSRSSINLPVGFPRMDVHDIEFSLCELDKYCRVKYGEGRPRSTYPGFNEKG